MRTSVISAGGRSNSPGFAAFRRSPSTISAKGALLLADPKALENPFFLLYPSWALLPIVILATLATIIASQAVITGAFSLTRQAIQLKLLPRMRIHHTSEAQEGQIYMPGVNVMLLIGVLALVLAFGSSSRLANAYGIAVTGTMAVTAMLAIIVVWKHWNWPLPAALALIVPFLAIDLVFLGANLMKVLEGGYVPLLIGVAVVTVMWTWVRGTAVLARKDLQGRSCSRTFYARWRRRCHRPSPAPPFPHGQPQLAPVALMHSLKHFKSLHEQNVILTVVTADVLGCPTPSA